MVYPEQRAQQLQRVIQRLGLPPHAPVDFQLLDLALTHPSANPNANYEQLEFVGDAVVRLLASEVLMNEYPDAPVGDYAAIRSVVVSDRVLAEWGEQYGLDRYLIMHQGQTGRRQKFVRLADVFEAVLGALYRSTRDMSLIEAWLVPLLKQKSAEVRRDPAFYNYKDALQEWTQGQYQQLPTYKVHPAPEPTPPEKRFIAQVWFQERCLGKGYGHSKKAAEQAAAKQAFLEVIETQQPTAEKVSGGVMS